MIAKIDGKYWVYWGEKFVNVATSTDLVNWEPMLDENGDLLKVITPRGGKFDSSLTECGPPAIITDKGILLMYNGKIKPVQKAIHFIQQILIAPDKHCLMQKIRLS